MLRENWDVLIGLYGFLKTSQKYNSTYSTWQAFCKYGAFVEKVICLVLKQWSYLRQGYRGNFLLLILKSGQVDKVESVS